MDFKNVFSFARHPHSDQIDALPVESSFATIFMYKFIGMIKNA